jgi:hypothetical protein
MRRSQLATPQIAGSFMGFHPCVADGGGAAPELPLCRWGMLELEPECVADPRCVADACLDLLIDDWPRRDCSGLPANQHELSFRRGVLGTQR